MPEFEVIFSEPAAGIFHQILQVDTVFLVSKISLKMSDHPFSSINSDAGQVAELTGLARFDSNTCLGISGRIVGHVAQIARPFHSITRFALLSYPPVLLAAPELG